MWTAERIKNVFVQYRELICFGLGFLAALIFSGLYVKSDQYKEKEIDWKNIYKYSTKPLVFVLISLCWVICMLCISLTQWTIKKLEDVVKKREGRRKLLVLGVICMIKYSAAVVTPAFSTIMGVVFNDWKSRGMCVCMVLSIGLVLCGLGDDEDFGLTDAWVAVILTLSWNKFKNYGELFAVSSGCGFRKVLIFSYDAIFKKPPTPAVQETEIMGRIEPPPPAQESPAMGRAE